MLNYAQQQSGDGVKGKEKLLILYSQPESSNKLSSVLFYSCMHFFPPFFNNYGKYVLRKE
jgi:hypothetical protein